jgi:archaellum component FlaF (FlaF/FlaG flagellin family)
VLTHSGSKLIVFGSYLANKDFIKEVLCINKEKVSMACEGKCHLKKELEKDSGNDKSNPKPVEVKTELAGVELDLKDFYFSGIMISDSHNTPYFFPLNTAAVLSIFHPPQA